MSGVGWVGDKGGMDDVVVYQDSQNVPVGYFAHPHPVIGAIRRYQIEIRRRIR